MVKFTDFDIYWNICGYSGLDEKPNLSWGRGGKPTDLLEMAGLPLCLGGAWG